jgi:hypothetical protein
MEIGQNFATISDAEQNRLIASAAGMNPLFHLGTA